jgi:hypothetical protein
VSGSPRSSKAGQLPCCFHVVGKISFRALGIEEVHKDVVEINKPIEIVFLRFETLHACVVSIDLGTEVVDLNLALEV